MGGIGTDSVSRVIVSPLVMSGAGIRAAAVRVAAASASIRALQASVRSAGEAFTQDGRSVFRPRRLAAAVHAANVSSRRLGGASSSSRDIATASIVDAGDSARDVDRSAAPSSAGDAMANPTAPSLSLGLSASQGSVADASALRLSHARDATEPVSRADLAHVMETMQAFKQRFHHLTTPPAPTRPGTAAAADSVDELATEAPPAASAGELLPS